MEREKKTPRTDPPVSERWQITFLNSHRQTIANIDKERCNAKQTFYKPKVPLEVSTDIVEGHQHQTSPKPPSNWVIFCLINESCPSSQLIYQLINEKTSKLIRHQIINVKITFLRLL